MSETGRSYGEAGGWGSGPGERGGVTCEAGWLYSNAAVLFGCVVMRAAGGDVDWTGPDWSVGRRQKADVAQWGRG